MIPSDWPIDTRYGVSVTLGDHVRCRAVGERGRGGAMATQGPLKRLKNVFQPDLTAYDPALLDKVDQSLLTNCKPHHRQAVELAMHDLYGQRMEALVSLPKAWERHIADNMLQDRRDLPLFLTFLQCVLWVVFSSAVQIFALPQNGWGYLWMLVHIPVTWILLAERFILAMHYSAHRPLFSQRGKHARLATFVNSLPQLLLSNFWGMPAGSYYLHHIVMHHNVRRPRADAVAASIHPSHHEPQPPPPPPPLPLPAPPAHFHVAPATQSNNLFPYDISSTMPYDRGNCAPRAHSLRPCERSSHRAGPWRRQGPHACHPLHPRTRAIPPSGRTQPPNPRRHPASTPPPPRRPRP